MNVKEKLLAVFEYLSLISNLTNGLFVLTKELLLFVVFVLK